METDGNGWTNMSFSALFDGDGKHFVSGGPHVRSVISSEKTINFMTICCPMLQRGNKQLVSDLIFKLM